MSSPTFQTVPPSTNRFLHRCIVVSVFLLASTAKIEINAIETNQSGRVPASVLQVESQVKPNHFSAQQIFQAPKVTREIALLHTSQGFIPSALVLDTAHTFDLHIVNINLNTKTASIFIDEFGVQQSMPFAEDKKIQIRPRHPGKYFIVSPESGFEATLTVIETQKSK